MPSDAGLFISLVNYCNTQIDNVNEYHIAKVILESISHADDLSLEMLAHQAHISQASISRFIKKAGFTSYQQFREAAHKATTSISLSRQLQNVTRFILDDDEALIDKLYQESIHNLTATREHINLTLLREIVSLMKTATSVNFYGDDHALSLFFTLQLDILSNGVPAYLFKKEDFQLKHASLLQEQDLVIFLNVFDGFMTTQQKQMLSDMHQRHVKSVIMCQDVNPDWEQFFDVVYYYGQSKTDNVGFYSLYYLSIVLSELYYRDQFK